MSVLEYSDRVRLPVPCRGLEIPWSQFLFLAAITAASGRKFNLNIYIKNCWWQCDIIFGGETRIIPFVSSNCKKLFLPQSSQQFLERCWWRFRGFPGNGVTPFPIAFPSPFPTPPPPSPTSLQAMPVNLWNSSVRRSSIAVPLLYIGPPPAFHYFLVAWLCIGWTCQIMNLIRAVTRKGEGHFMNATENKKNATGEHRLLSCLCYGAQWEIKL